MEKADSYQVRKLNPRKEYLIPVSYTHLDVYKRQITYLVEMMLRQI